MTRLPRILANAISARSYRAALRVSLQGMRGFVGSDAVVPHLPQ
jgi:hypothetical protein